MKSVGIIIEYNPFTNGHAYHLQKAKELTGADVVIGVLSSSFVQRGEPAIISKEERVKIALDAGVDIIVELPFIHAVEMADYFASGTIKMLHHLGVKDIVFGSETGDTEEFLAKYDSVSIIQPHLDFLIKDYMDEGYSYPAAFKKACDKIDVYQSELPNDILGVAYKKYIDQNNLDINIHTIKREFDYMDESLDNKLVSASALRKALKEGKDISPYTPYSDFKEFHFLDDYFDLLRDILIMKTPEELSSIHLVEEGIEYLLKKNILKASSMDEFIGMCTSKRYTSSRIRRIICHILANSKKDIVRKELKDGPSYIRLLGINSKGEEYLKSIRKDLEVPVLNRFKGKEFPLLNLERNITYLYYHGYKDQMKHYEDELYIYPIRKNI